LQFDPPDAIVRAAWEKGINAPQSSAVGRVFDAAAALVLGVRETSFEGQGPMWLQAIAAASGTFPSLPIEPDGSGLARINWAPLLPWLADTGRTTADRAATLHLALVDAMARVCEAERIRTGAVVVGLTGGVFQNRRLSELACATLEPRGFRVLLAERVPCNDGGLSYGQVADFLGRNA
jgi:hydrogenase maturation protein HypF